MTVLNKKGDNIMGLLDGKVALGHRRGRRARRGLRQIIRRTRAPPVVVNDLGGPRDGSGADCLDGAAGCQCDQGRRRPCGGQWAPISRPMAGGQSVFDDAIKHFGRADILVNNAGILLDQTFAKATEAAWDKVLKVHLKGTFLRQPAGVPLDAGSTAAGVIVNTSSDVGPDRQFRPDQLRRGPRGRHFSALSNVLAIEGRKI